MQKMSSFDAIKRDVALAQRLAMSCESPAAEKSVLPHTYMHPHHHYPPITVSDPLPHGNESVRVTIHLARVFTSSGKCDKCPVTVLVRADLEIIFGPSYPKKPPQWRFIDDHYSESASPDVSGYPVVRLQSFLIDDALSQIPKPEKTYAAVCMGDAGNVPTYHRTSRSDAMLLASSVEVAANTSVEMYSANMGNKGGTSGNSNNTNNNNNNNNNSGSASKRPSVSSNVKKTANNNTKNNSNSNNSCSSAVGVEVSAQQFLSYFVFLSAWWTALELDEGCILQDRPRGMPGNASSGSMSFHDDDVGCKGFFREGRGVHLEDEAVGNRVRRPRRSFAAIFMPCGEVLAWGLRQTTQSNKKEEEKNRRKSSMSDAEGLMTGQVHSGAVLSNGGGNWSGYSTVYMDPVGRRAYSNQQYYYDNGHSNSSNIQRTCQLLRITSIRSDISGEVVLPSLLVPSNILRTEAYELNDLSLYAEDPSVALYKNACISREGKSLNDVSNAFYMLRHLVKGVSPHTSSLCALRLIAPALHEVVHIMQKQKKPFWAGVAICCILTPAILNNQSAAPFDIAGYLIDPVESYRCVSLVAMIFSVIQSTNKFREAELTKKAIMTAYCAKQSLSPLSCKTNYNDEGQFYRNQHVSQSLCHVPITECAVCGLPLLRITQLGNTNGHGKNFRNSCENNKDEVLSPFAKEDGYLILQCARCGHGGHEAHILLWWQDESVRFCPKGCECVCIY